MLCGMRGIGAATAATVRSGSMRRAILAFAVVATVLAGLLGMHVLELHGASAAGHGAGSGAVAHAAMGDGGSSVQAANTHAASSTAPSAAGAAEAAPAVDTSASAGSAGSVESDGTNGMGDTAGMAMMCVLALLLVALAARLRRRFVLRIPAPARGSAQRRSLPRLAPRIPDPPTPLLLGISRT